MTTQRQLPRPVRVYHYLRTPKEGGGYDYPRTVLHERALFHMFGPESTEGSDDVVHGMAAVVELPDGNVITAAAHMIQFLDTAEWLPITSTGQVRAGMRLRFTIGDKQLMGSAKQVLHAGTEKEEVIYDKGRNFYFITSMVLDGSSNHKSVEFFGTRGA